MRRRTDKLAVVCTVLCLLCTVVTVVFVAPTVLDTNQTTAQIQLERARNVLSNCEDSNARHDRTVAQLERLVEAIRDPVRRARAVQGMAGTVALIDALAPKRDCRALVERQVDTK